MPKNTRFMTFFLFQCGHCDSVHVLVSTIVEVRFHTSIEAAILVAQEKMDIQWWVRIDYTEDGSQMSTDLNPEKLITVLPEIVMEMAKEISGYNATVQEFLND